ncbi:YqjK family protein [Niveibacterium microcysteis]|uniref:YqjK-like protein n=1 Tax=Niveibacterium microcysteis TaxID=2811415 RepID=A0ABX7M4V0_9RHOO|nr:YqjK family protein [Niveibacterium microcysteis]QSI76451.1 hypothetical protein JY500_18635 [Niveibacterium microcysteis]
MAPTGLASRLALRRAELVERSGRERARLVADLGALAPAFGAADKVVAAASWARRHGAVIVIVAAAVLAVRRPSRLLKYAGQAWSLWQVYRGYRDRLDGLIERIERR